MQEITILVLFVTLASVYEFSLAAPTEPETSQAIAVDEFGVDIANIADRYKHLVESSEHPWNASGYYSSNQLQRRDAKEAILKCSPVLQWRLENGSSLLDVGSGSGDVTTDIVKPILPVNFRRLVGVDLSENMVDFARENNSDPRISFEQFDVGLELEKQTIQDIEPFDHITSFYCLHWVQNQEVAIKNLHNLLKPGGDMFFIFLGQSPVYDVYKTLSGSEKWAEYMSDIDQFISPYQYSKNPVDDFSRLVVSKGFFKLDVQLQEKSFTFKGIESFKKMIISIDAFYSRIPENRQNNYLDDILQMWKQSYPDLNNDAEGTYTLTYKTMTAYAKKLK